MGEVENGEIFTVLRVKNFILEKRAWFRFKFYNQLEFSTSMLAGNARKGKI